MRRLWLVLALGALATWGCSDDPGGTAIDAGGTGFDSDVSVGEAELAIDPADSDFGTVPVGGESSETDFVVTNEGGAESTAISVAVSGDGFAIGGDACTDASLAAGESCTVSVIFQPAEAGDASGELEVSATEGGTATAALEGTGSEPGELSITPTPHDFDAVVTGESLEQEFEVENTGEADTGDISVEITGDNPTEFETVADNCSDTSLGGGEACTITVAFAPSSTGDLTASVDATASPGGTASAALAGEGLAPASLSIDPTERDFGSVVQSETSGEVVFSVANDGDVDTTGLSVELVGDNPSEFSLNEDCAGSVLAPESTCEIGVRFAPTSVGEKSATLEVSATSGGIAQSFLDGDGIAEGELVVDVAPSEFGDTVVGETSASQTVTIRNSGDTVTGSLSTEIGGTNPTDFDFVEAGDQCGGQTLAADATCTMEVDFSPGAAGARAASLTVSADPGGEVVVSLNGDGLDEATLAFDQESQFFGSVSTVDSQDRTVTLTNTGDEATGELSLSIEEPSQGDVSVAAAADFSIFSDDCGTSLAGGESCDVTVRFAPETTGLREAQLRAEASPGGVDTVDLEGDAIEPGALAFDDATVDFGSVIEFETATASMVVRNTGEDDTSALSTAVSGDAEFSIVTANDGCQDTILGPDDTCSVELEFAPEAAGSFAAELEVSADLGGDIFGSLTGAGLARIEIDPASHDFGDHKPGNAATKTFSITNRGAQRTLATAFTGNTADFEISADTCDGVTVGPGGGCSVQVELTAPDALGAVASGALEVSSQGDDASASAQVDATVVGPLELDPETHDFGNVVTGDNLEQTFTLTNDGDNQVGPLTTVLDTADDFAVTDDECVGQVLEAGGDCTLAVRFFPQVAGTHTGSLALRDDTTGDEVSASLEGRGAAAADLVIDPESFDFDQVVVTQSANTTLTVTNEGEVAADILSASFDDGTHYTIDEDNCDGVALGAGASCTVDVTFAPVQGTTLDVKSDTLSVGDESVEATASLAGEAISQLTIDPTSADFGDVEEEGGAVELLASSDPVVFTVENRGALSANGISSSLSGDTQAFAIAANSCSNLAAGAQCTVEVTFTPPGPGPFSATLTSDANEGAVAVADPLVGNGLASAALEVSPSVHLFGGVRQGSVSTVDETFTYTNVGEVASGSLSTQLSGSVSNFVVIEDNCETTSLAPGGSCTIAVRFAPPTGEEDGLRFLDIVVEDGETAGAFASALGFALDAESTLVANPEEVDFGPVVAGESSGAVSVQISNTTGTDSGELGVDVSQAFTVSNDGCTGTSLPAGQSCTLDVAFTPSSDSEPSTQEEQVLSLLQVSDLDGLVESPAVATLQGVRLDPAQLTVELALGEGTFGDVALGSSRSVGATVANTGDQTSGPISILFSGDEPSAYDVEDDLCTGETLGGGEECTFTLTFTPFQLGPHDADGAVLASPGGEASGPLTGNGVNDAALTIDPQDDTCGTEVPAGIEVADSVCSYTVENTGELATGPLAIELGDAANFAILAEAEGSCLGGLPLAAGDSCILEVAYLPTGVASHGSTVTVSGDPGGSAEANANGSAVSALSGPENPSPLTAVVGDSSSARSVTISNAAGTPVTDQLTVTLGGDDADRFGITRDDCSGVSVAGGDSCSLSIRFVPEAVGEAEVEVNVTDGTANKTTTVFLTGEGFQEL